ncbi:MAG: exodeoxyribonuclease VII large subunit [Planctomycetota bacterium]
MTERLPFDPDRMRGPTPAPRRGSSAPLSVSRLGELIAQALQGGLPSAVRVVGEISNFNDRTHWYFALKDEHAVVSCVMFASAAKSAGVQPRPGDRVVATGSINHYAPQGRTQLYVERLEPAGLGDLEQRLRALVERLRAAGYLDEQCKRPLPVFPRAVAVVTSRTGAALQDVLDTMRHRCPAVGVVLVDVRVQGDAAAGQVAEAIRRINDRATDLGVDAVLVTRGGGSIEDLWAFNEQAVADAIFESELPVVAAIGHETDTTVAELVADVRAATPTQAAMRLTPDRAALREQIDERMSRLTLLVRRGAATERQRLDALASRPILRRPGSVLRDRRSSVSERGRRLVAAMRDHVRTERLRVAKLTGLLSRHQPATASVLRRERLGSLGERLRRAVDLHPRRVALDGLQRSLEDAAGARLERERHRAAALARELSIVGPVRVLSRGYSVTTREDGAIVREPADAPERAIIVTRLANGEIRSIVRTSDGSSAPPPTSPSAEAPPPRRRAARRSARRKGDDPRQHRLF